MSAHNVAVEALTALLLLVLIVFRLLWGGSQVAAASGLGRLPMLPKRCQRWLHGEREPGRHAATTAPKQK